MSLCQKCTQFMTLLMDNLDIGEFGTDRLAVGRSL